MPMEDLHVLGYCRFTHSCSLQPLLECVGGEGEREWEEGQEERREGKR